MRVLEGEEQRTSAELLQARKELHGDQRAALVQVVTGAPKAHGQQIVRARGVGGDFIRLVEQRYRAGQGLPEFGQGQLTGRGARQMSEVVMGEFVAEHEANLFLE